MFQKCIFVYLLFFSFQKIFQNPFLSDNNQVKSLKLQLFFLYFLCKYFLIFLLFPLNLAFRYHKDGFKLLQKYFYFVLLFLLILSCFLSLFKL